MKQILAATLIILCSYSFGQSQKIDTLSNSDTTITTITTKYVSVKHRDLFNFRPRTRINNDSLGMLLKDFDSIQYMNNGQVEYKLKKIGNKLDDNTIFFTLVRTKDNTYVIRLYIWYHSYDNPLYFLNYMLVADNQNLQVNPISPLNIHWNGQKSSEFMQVADKTTYAMILKMLTAKDPQVLYQGRQGTYTGNFGKYEKKNITKVLELLKLLAEQQ